MRRWRRGQLNEAMEGGGKKRGREVRGGLTRLRGEDRGQGERSGEGGGDGEGEGGGDREQERR